MGLADLQQAVVVILLVIPGIVFQAARSRLRGLTPDDLDTSGRVLRALGTSAFLAVVYVAVLGNWLTAPLAGEPRDFGESPRDEAWWAILLIFIVPIGLAHILQAIAVYRNGHRWRYVARNLVRYDPAPTAWDKAAANRPPCFIRILTGDGLWVGGLAEGDSLISAYPQPRDIFLEQAWELDSDGQLVKPVNGNLGEWVRCDDARIVQFLRNEADIPAGALDVTEQGNGGHTQALERRWWLVALAIAVAVRARIRKVSE